MRRPVHHLFKFLLACIVLYSAISSAADAQGEQKQDTTFKPAGKLWGLVFGDYFYKANCDALNRGGANQYTNIEQGRNAFQIRRIYLGYNYDIAPKFSAELLLAAEDNLASTGGIPTGDLLTNNKLGLYVKQANIRWKNIWKGTDLVVGQALTPAYPLLIEPIWGYRSIERTITDIRRTPSFDLGATLQGKFDPASANFGYDIMVGNGTGARPENDKFKWFYGDVWGKFLDKRLVFDLYADYQRTNWTPTAHHSRNMFKGFAAYTTPGFTVGTEAFVSHGKNDVVGTKGAVEDTLDANATGISVFVHGNLIKEKLAFFARMDKFNPDLTYDATGYTSYKGLSANYEPNNKETFMTAGVDFTPVKNVHFMPNVWYNRYHSQQPALSNGTHDYDLVYRITFYYVYGR